MSILEVACLLRLLPSLRAAVLQQSNAAYRSNEAFTTDSLKRRLWLDSPEEVARCMTAHGVANKPPLARSAPGHELATSICANDDQSADATFYFRTGSFTASLKAPMEPPLPLPNIPAVCRLGRSRSGSSSSSRSCALDSSSGSRALASIQTAPREDDRLIGAAVADEAVASLSEGEATASARSDAHRNLPSKKKKRRPPPASLLASTSEAETPSPAEWVWVLLHDGIELPF